MKRLGTSLRGQARVSQRRLETRAERSALGTAPDIAVIDVGLNFLSPKTKLLNHMSKKTKDPSTISTQEACFDLHERYLFLRPDQNLKLGIGFA